MTASASSFACHSDKISRCDTADRYQDLVRRSVPDREFKKSLHSSVNDVCLASNSTSVEPHVR